jgi:hypothetical protein
MNDRIDRAEVKRRRAAFLRWDRTTANVSPFSTGPHQEISVSEPSVYSLIYTVPSGPVEVIVPNEITASEMGAVGRWVESYGRLMRGQTINQNASVGVASTALPSGIGEGATLPGGESGLPDRIVPMRSSPQYATRKSGDSWRVTRYGEDYGRDEYLTQAGAQYVARHLNAAFDEHTAAAPSQESEETA